MSSSRRRPCMRVPTQHEESSTRPLSLRIGPPPVIVRLPEFQTSGGHRSCSELPRETGQYG